MKKGREVAPYSDHTQLPAIDPNNMPYEVDVTMRVYGEHEVRETFTLAGVLIPEGFSTDFGSVPWWLWGVVPPIGRPLFAYLVHDWLYRHSKGSRKYADKLLKEICRWYGVHWFRRLLMYWGVRAGGFFAWRRNRK